MQLYIESHGVEFKVEVSINKETPSEPETVELHKITWGAFPNMPDQTPNLKKEVVDDIMSRVNYELLWNQEQDI